MTSLRCAFIAVCVPALLSGQAADSVRLGALQVSAIQHDPRLRELDLLARQSRNRLQNIDAERRPALSVESQAQYQSDVAHIQLALPGVSIPTPAHDTYDAHLGAQQKLFDPTTAARRSLESAQLAESEARLRVVLYPVRQRVNDAFFAALRAQLQVAEMQTTLTDLEAQRDAAARRVREGSALPSEELILRAELLRRRQGVSELRASERAALDVLRELTGSSIDTSATLAVPGVDERAALRLAQDERQRPEYAQFALSRELLQRQEDLRGTQDKPRISAFGRAGYGRPGLNPLSDKFGTYWLAGMQLQWTPFNWGTTDRDRETLTLQRQVIDAEVESFTQALRTAVAQDRATVDRLTAALASDDEIVNLRDAVLAEFRARFTEGVITSAEYVDRQTDALGARIARAQHRAELAQANAHFLTTLGLEVR